jgi:nicotinate (nicotinamide) nucleotide adenylyltransferase
MIDTAQDTPEGAIQAQMLDLTRFVNEDSTFRRSSIIDCIPVAREYPPRDHVAPHNRSWSKDYPEYAPSEYTSPSVIRNDRTKNNLGYADPENLTKEEFAELFAAPERHSYEGKLKHDPETGRPLNPLGRVGISGRAALGKWGPNHAADAIVTREYGGELQVLLVRRPSGEWALPGGFVDSGEAPLTTALRELCEETGMNLLDFCISADPVYQGIVGDRMRSDKADPRITDHAWVETNAFHFHLSEGHPALQQNLCPENQNSGLKWAPVTHQVAESLYASHGKLLSMAIAQSREWRKDSFNTGQISDIPHEPLLTNLRAIRGRVGILGGSFDPVHTEHVHLAEIIREKHDLEAVIFIPTNQNPLKEHSPSGSPAERLTMLEIALADHPGLFVSPVQLRDETLDRTVDLIEHIKREIPPDFATLFLILGADCIAQLPRWKNPEKLHSLVEIIACSRDGYTSLKDLAESDHIRGPQRHSIHWTDVKLSPTSSTTVRRSLLDGNDPDGLDPRVFDYIKEHGLYGLSPFIP